MIKQLASNYIRRHVKTVVDKLDTEVANFEKQDGYLRLDGNTALQAFFEPDKLKSEMQAMAKEQLELSGANPAEVWTQFDASRAALWKKVRDAGPNWKAPAQDGKEAAALSAAKKQFKSTKVSKAYMTRASWLVHKNSLGVVLSRTKPGYIIYKEAGDEKLAGSLCRARGFSYEEQRVGRKFKKSSGIGELGFIRFEPCR